MENILSVFPLTTDTGLPRDGTSAAQMQPFPNSSVQFSRNHLDHLGLSHHPVCPVNIFLCADASNWHTFTQKMCSWFPVIQVSSDAPLSRVDAPPLSTVVHSSLPPGGTAVFQKQVKF